MRFHNSIGAEKFCVIMHTFWSVISLLSAMFALAAMYRYFPDAGFHSKWGLFFSAAEYDNLALVILGAGGSIWHAWGARQHEEEVKRLEGKP